MSVENSEMCQQYYIYSFIFVHGCGARLWLCVCVVCVRACARVLACSLNVLMSCSSTGGLNRDSVVLNNVLRHEPTLDKWIKPGGKQEQIPYETR